MLLASDYPQKSCMATIKYIPIIVQIIHVYSPNIISKYRSRICNSFALMSRWNKSLGGFLYTCFVCLLNNSDRYEIAGFKRMAFLIFLIVAIVCDDDS